MATRLYLTATAAPYTPTTKRGGWDTSSSAAINLLGRRPAGTAASRTQSEASTTAAWDVLLSRYITDGAYTAGTISGTMSFGIGRRETNAAADMYWHLHVYVTVGDSDTVRGTLVTDYIGATEFPTTATGEVVTGIAVSSVAVQAGDRIVVEVGYRAQNVVATSYSGVINYGNTGVADLTNGSTSVTTQPGWVEFSGADGILNRQIDTLVDDFSSGTFDTTVWSGNYGTVTITGGRARVAAEHTAGVPDYAGVFADSSVGSLIPWHLANSAVYCEVPTRPAAGGTYAYCQLNVLADEVGTAAAIQYDANNNQLHCLLNVAYDDASPTTIAFDATAHRWWRIRHDGSSLYWETSADGTTWTARRTTATPPSWVNYGDLFVLLEAARDGGTDDFAEFDNVNVTGGTAYTPSGTDAVGLTDAATAVLTVDQTATDGVGLTDAGSAALTADRTTADTAGLSDAATSAAGFDRAPVDPVGLLDAATAAVDAGRAPADTVGLLDAVTAAAGYVRAATDLAGLTDAGTATIDATRTLTDTVGLLDAATGVTGFDRAPVDTVGLTDTVTAATSFDRTPSDSLGATDTATPVVGSARSTTDLAGLTDAVAPVRAVASTAADPVGLTDAATAVTAATRTPADTAGLADAVTPVVTADRTVTDTVGLTDGVTIDTSSSGASNVSDAAGITDTTVTALAATRTPTDLVGLTDGVVADYGTGVARTATDTVGLTDTAALSVDATRVSADPVGLTDAVMVDTSAAGTASGTDTTSLIDAVTAAVAADRATGDVAGLLDTADTAHTAARTPTDTAALLDAVATAAGATRTPADQVGLVDHVTAETGAGAEPTDPVGLTDLVFVEVTLTRLVTDALGAVDVLGALGDNTPPGLPAQYLRPGAVVVRIRAGTSTTDDTEPPIRAHAPLARLRASTR